MAEFLPSTLSERESRDLFERLPSKLRDQGFGMWAIEVPGRARFIGFAGLWVPTFEAPFTPCVEMAWRLAPAFWGKGYATEAAHAAMAYGFDVMGFPRLLAWTVPENTRSRRIMEKLGMRWFPNEDFEHPNLPVGHRLRRHVLYRIARSEWTGG